MAVNGSTPHLQCKWYVFEWKVNSMTHQCCTLEVASRATGSKTNSAVDLVVAIDAYHGVDPNMHSFFATILLCFGIYRCFEAENALFHCDCYINIFSTHKFLVAPAPSRLSWCLLMQWPKDRTKILVIVKIEVLLCGPGFVDIPKSQYGSIW